MILALNAPKAAMGMVDVLDDPTSLGARNAVVSAEEVLDRTGLIKKEQLEVKSQEGAFYITTKKVANDEDEPSNDEMG